MHGGLSNMIGTIESMQVEVDMPEEKENEAGGEEEQSVYLESS